MVAEIAEAETCSSELGRWAHAAHDAMTVCSVLIERSRL